MKVINIKFGYGDIFYNKYLTTLSLSGRMSEKKFQDLSFKVAQNSNERL